MDSTSEEPLVPAFTTSSADFSLKIPTSSNQSSPIKSEFQRPRFPSNARYSSAMSSVFSADEASLEDNYQGESEDSLVFDDLICNGSDPLHIPEKPYPRHGRSRYIIETDNPFTIWSLRGWLNLGAVVALLLVLISLFGLLPILDYAFRVSTLDSQTVELSRQSGPFDVTQLPQRLDAS